MIFACALMPAPLAPKTSAATPSADLPLLESDSTKLRQALDSGEASALIDLSHEGYQGEMHKPGVQKYTVDIQTAQKVDLSIGWCARTKAIMEDNKAHFDGSVSINDHVIGLDGLVSNMWDMPAGQNPDAPEGLKCFSYDILASQWSPGKYHIQETYSFDAPVDDGYGTYAAGTYILDYEVTVTARGSSS
jgi:hypothetical protein